MPLPFCLRCCWATAESSFMHFLLNFAPGTLPAYLGHPCLGTAAAFHSRWMPKPAVLNVPLQEGMSAWVTVLILLTARSQNPSPLLHGSQVHSSSLQPPWPAHSQQACPSLASLRPRGTGAFTATALSKASVAACLFASCEFSPCLSPGGVVLWVYWLNKGIDLLRAFLPPFSGKYCYLFHLCTPGEKFF